ncbi:hypothetical protein RJ639_006853 [Escallonia herrerae]|uniref:Uncharacterized protein n=1 Tax=Escallonia herrerae TaxID=1293975 RepID=A0AA88W0V5_9ASTE|nr:hypothetical protein RJ639_006853 [Escallonia herrerae]
MKNGASIFFKRIISVLSSIANAKSVAAIKGKADALKARLLMLSLLQNKKLPHLGTAISHKIHAILGRQHGKGGDDHDDDDGTNGSKAIVIYNHLANESLQRSSSTDTYYYYYNDEDDDKYPDLRHSLFAEEEELDEELGDPNGSAIDMVKNSTEEHGGNFSLEDEIDQVADLFIKKFHKRMRLQKLESFKRRRDMLDRRA